MTPLVWRKTRYFSTTSMLCDRYCGFPPLYRKANKVLQGGVFLRFIGSYGSMFKFCTCNGFVIYALHTVIYSNTPRVCCVSVARLSLDWWGLFRVLSAKGLSQHVDNSAIYEGLPPLTSEKNCASSKALQFSMLFHQISLSPQHQDLRSIKRRELQELEAM